MPSTARSRVPQDLTVPHVCHSAIGGPAGRSEAQLLLCKVEFLYVCNVLWVTGFYVGCQAFVISTRLVTGYGLHGLRGMTPLLELMQ